MAARLILGCGSMGHTILEKVNGLSGSTTVLDTDSGRVEALRNDRVAAEQADITDPNAIGGREIDMVIVAGDDAGVNLAAASAGRDAYPSAQLLAYPGQRATLTQRDRLATLADDVIDPGAYVLDHVTPFISGEQSVRARELRDVLASIDGTLGVVTHDNPDPDAIASAVALVEIAEALGCDAEATYYGEISHQENRAFVNLLDVELSRYEAGEPPPYEAIALVDHSRPGVNDQLPTDTSIDIVIDHHPVSVEVDARFVDVRPSVGATSTMLVDYLDQFLPEPPKNVATALLYGIRVDTDEFTRDIVPEDFEAASTLLKYADTGILERVESPKVSADTFDTIARAIKRRQIEGTTLASCVGPISDRDTLAQAADELLTMEGIATTLVSGFTDGMIYISARSRRHDVDLGAALRSAFDDLGSAGGHTDMAGAQIPMGVFEELGPADERRLAEIVEGIVADRFFTVIRSDVASVESVENRESQPEEHRSDDDLIPVVVRVEDGTHSGEDESVPDEPRSQSGT
jgi:nanoRNase/pAp phosphatase (c-di-AMP/oligoRNAs hydrolase)